MRLRGMTSSHLTLLSTLVALGLAAIPSQAVRAQSPEGINDPEVYSVYASAVQTRFTEKEKLPTALALLQETRAGADCVDRAAENTLPPEWRSVVQSFRRENARVRTIREGFDLGLPYSIVTVPQLKQLMRAAGYPKPGLSNAPGWEVFARFPGGRLVALSAVGFNPEKTRAMVAIQADCFPSFTGTEHRVCHEGRHILLEKKGGRWVIVNGVLAGCIWIA